MDALDFAVYLFFEGLAFLTAPFTTLAFFLAGLIQQITGQCLACCEGYCV